MARYEDEFDEEDYGYEPDGRSFGKFEDDDDYDDYPERDTRVILPPQNIVLRVLLWPLYATVNGLNALRIWWWDEVLETATSLRRFFMTWLIALPFEVVVAFIGYLSWNARGWIYAFASIAGFLILVHALVASVMYYLLREED